MQRGIVIIINSLGAGGAESYLCRVLIQLTKSTDVTVLTLFDEVDYNNLPGGCTRVKLDFKKRPFESLRKLINYIRLSDPKLILTWLTISNFIGLIIGFMLNKKTICNVRQSSIFLRHASIFSNFLAFVNLFIYRFADSVIFNSDFGRKSHEIKYLPKFNSVVVKNGMPTTLKPNLTKPRSFEKCVTVNLGFVARNNKIKNFGMFQQICWEVSGMLPTKALVFGDGYDLEKAKSDPERANILIFKGFVHDKEEIYANLDILVVTSKSEGMPNNVLEALSAGLWVVCYPVGGLIELRHPRLIKVTHYSVKSYADAILDVASNKSSGEAVTKYDTEEMSIKRYISRIQ